MKYVDNEKLLEELKKRRKYIDLNIDKEKPRVNEYLGRCFLDIAQNLCKKSRFNRYSYKADMISHAVYSCVRYIDTFDVKKGDKPFSYFTQVCWNSFFFIINGEEKQQYLKYKTFENFMTDNDLSQEDKPKDVKQYENINEFVDNFETREKEKRLKAKENLKGRKK